jgi:hypothetical protein
MKYTKNFALTTYSSLIFHDFVISFIFFFVIISPFSLYLILFFFYVVSYLRFSFPPFFLGVRVLSPGLSQKNAPQPLTRNSLSYFAYTRPEARSNNTARLSSPLPCYAFIFVFLTFSFLSISCVLSFRFSYFAI